MADSSAANGAGAGAGNVDAATAAAAALAAGKPRRTRGSNKRNPGLCVCFVSALRYPLSLCVLCGLCGLPLPLTIPDHSVTCCGVNNATEARANPCSYLFLWYMNGIVSLGHSRTITQDDIDSQWPVRPGDDAATMQDRFGKLWREQKQRPK